MNSLQDVGDLFRTGQIELYFSKIVEALYDGKRFVSQDEVLNKVGLVKIQLVTQNLEIILDEFQIIAAIQLGCTIFLKGARKRICSIGDRVRCKFGGC